MGQPCVGYLSSTPTPGGALCLGLIELGITPVLGRCWVRAADSPFTGDLEAVVGDAAPTGHRILWDRAEHTIHTTDPTAAERVSAALRSLGDSANKDRSEAAAARVPALRAALPT